MFYAVAQVDRSIDGSAGTGVGREARPDSAPQHDARLVDFVSLHSPRLVRLLEGSVVQEVEAEDVLFASTQVNFLALLARTQVHVRVQVFKLSEIQSFEGLIHLDAADGILSVGANGDNLALSLDAVDDVAETVLFGDSIRGQLRWVKRARQKSHLI